MDDDTRDQIEKDFKSLTVEVDADLAGLKKLVDHEYEINTRLRQIKEQAEEVSKKNPRASTGPRISMPAPSRFDTEAEIDEVIKRLQAMKEKLPADVDWEV